MINMTSNIMNIPPNPLTYQSASVMSSDLDSTSLFETESEITLDRDMTGQLFLAIISTKVFNIYVTSI